MTKIIKDQIKIIHVEVSRIGLTRPEYEQMLAANYGVITSKDLTFVQADELIKKLKAIAPAQEKPLKYDEYKYRDPDFATPAQMRLIEALWMTNPNVKQRNEQGLNHFIRRISGVDHLKWLLKKDVQRVIKAIKSLT